MELETYLRFVIALAFVLGLIALAAWGLRKLGYGGVPVRNGGRLRRLGVVEVTAIDARRRLVLVRRDNVEHLLLLGVNQDLVIEGGIQSATGTPRSGAEERTAERGPA